MIDGKVLIDGDIVAYRAAHVTDKDFPEDAKSKVDELMGDILDKTTLFSLPDEYTVYLTGKGNFRYSIATKKVYKGNRVAAVKPRYLPLLRDYLTVNYNAITSEGEEADDLIAIEATKLGPSTTIASTDKDFMQIPCHHYNLTKETFTKVSKEEAVRSFYTQLLTGDKIDNIGGAPGIGPKKAVQIYKDCKTEEDFWKAALEAYKGDRDHAIECGRLLWLRRKEGELWEPPVSVEDTQ